MATGYMYTQGVDGYYFNQFTPAGTFDYAQYMLGVLLENADGKTLDDLFEYDGDTRTATYAFDGAAQANAYLAPIISKSPYTSMPYADAARILWTACSTWQSRLSRPSPK